MIKYSFRMRFERFMTNVLKIAMRKNEEKITCLITAYYEFQLDNFMLIEALANDKYYWLMFVWAFEKNFLGQKNDENSKMTFEKLFMMIKE